jgi:hypothetical protein
MTTKRDALAARRTKKRRQGVATLANGREMPWEDLLGEVATMRRDLEAAELEAIVTARVSGASWDRISLALQGRRTAEGLRKRYADRVREASNDVVLHAGLARRDAARRPRR